MKHLLITLFSAAMLLSLASCGSDDPEPIRDRDVTMSIDALTHALDLSTGETTLTTGTANTVLVHQKLRTADFTLVANFGGSRHEYSVSGVALTPVADQDYRYTFTSSGGGGGVTNLAGTIDLREQLLIMSYDAAGYHISVTIPDVFFEQTIVRFTFADATTGATADSFWTLKVGSDTRIAQVSIGNLFISGDLMRNADGVLERKGNTLRIFNANATEVTPTEHGFRITAANPTCVATAGPNAIVTDDYMMQNIDLNVDLSTGRLEGTMNIRHVLKRDLDLIPTEWDDIDTHVSGQTFRTSPFD